MWRMTMHYWYIYTGLSQCLILLLSGRVESNCAVTHLTLTYHHIVILQHPVALHKSAFTFCFYAVYVQLRLTIHSSFFFIDTTCFSLTSHLHVYRLLWLWNLLLTVKLPCFPYMVALDYIWLYGLTICFNFGVLELEVFVLSVNVQLKDTQII
jgi:hypothetical protein